MLNRQDGGEKENTTTAEARNIARVANSSTDSPSRVIGSTLAPADVPGAGQCQCGAGGPEVRLRAAFEFEGKLQGWGWGQKRAVRGWELAPHRRLGLSLLRDVCVARVSTNMLWFQCSSRTDEASPRSRLVEIHNSR